MWGHQVSAEALLTTDGMVAGTAVEGSMMKEMFIEYLALNVACLLLFLAYLYLTGLTATNVFCFSRSTQCPGNDKATMHPFV